MIRQRSSVVEQLTRNEQVAGSSPAVGSFYICSAQFSDDCVTTPLTKVRGLTAHLISGINFLRLLLERIPCYIDELQIKAHPRDIVFSR